jgi:hypothetical protein
VTWKRSPIVKMPERDTMDTRGRQKDKDKQENKRSRQEGRKWDTGLIVSESTLYCG